MPLLDDDELAQVKQMMAEREAVFDRALYEFGDNVPPCPSWCADRPGHPYDGVLVDDPPSLQRWHGSGGSASEVSQEEINTGGVVELFDPELRVYEVGRPGCSDLDVAEARRVIADLTAAVALFERIAHTEWPPPMPAPALLRPVPSAWALAIGMHLLWLQSGEASPATVDLRRLQLNRMARDLADVAPFSVTGDMLVGWLGTRAAQWKGETLRSHRSAITQFYKWAQRTGRMDHDPSEDLPPVRFRAGLPRPAPELEVRMALAAAEPRVRVMILLAATCGLRRAEIAGVRASDVRAGELRVDGKGRKVRIVPLPVMVEQAIVALAAANRAAEGRDGPGYLFPSSQAGLYRARGPDFVSVGPSEMGHLTPAYVGKLITRALGDGWTAHTLRHRFASVAYAAERDLRAVQALLGHSKPETTAIYTAVPDGALRRAVDAAVIGETAQIHWPRG